MLAIAASILLVACSADSTDSSTDATGAAPGGTPPEDGSSGTTDAGDSEATPSTPPSTTVATTTAVAARCTPGTAGSGAEPGEVTTLRMWHGFDGDVVSFFDDVIATFEAEHPGFDVEVSRFDGGYTDGIAALAGLDPAERPDVFMGSNASVRVQYDSGLFVSPSECTGGKVPEALTDLLPIIERTYTVGEELVAAPYNVSTAVMMYDRNLWRAAGVDPDDPPATFDELEFVIRRLRDTGAATTGMVLYDRASSWLVEQAAAQGNRLLVEPANGREGLATTDVSFATPEAIATLERFQALHNDGYLLWAGLNQSGRDNLLQLASTEAPSGLTLHTSAAIGDALRIVESGAIGGQIDVGVAPLPGDGPGGLAGGGAWWLLADDDPVRVGAAWTLVDWLIQPERVAELAAFTGYVPTTDRAADSAVTAATWAAEPVLRVGYDQLAAMPVTDAAVGMQVGPMIELQRALEVAASFTIIDNSDAGELLRAAERTARSSLEAYQAAFSDDD